MTRWVLHLPTGLTSRDAAVELAGVVRRALGWESALDFGELTVSAEDDQSTRYRVWCDSRLPSGRRCPQPHGHEGRCT